MSMTLLSLLLAMADRPGIEVVLKPEQIRPEVGGAFEAPIQVDLPFWLTVQGESTSGLGLSDLQLFEDARALGPAHAGHGSIRQEGGGRFSHWHRRVIFSTSDGSDPRHNGRSYRVVVRPVGALWIDQAGLILAGIGVVLGARLARIADKRLERMLPPIGFAAAVVVVLVIWNTSIWRFAPSWIAAQDDSASYLGAFEMRTIGYPFLLSLIVWVTGDLRALTIVQINMLVFAMAILCLATARVLGASRGAMTSAPDAERVRDVHPAWSAGALAMLFMGTSVRAFETSFTVMADGPFTAVVCMAAACLGFAAMAPSWRWATASGILVAVAILIRPAGLGLVPAVVLPWWWHRHGTVGGDPRASRRALRTLLVPALLAVVLPLGAESLRNYASRGFFGLSSMGSMSLAGHVAWMITPETVPSEPELAARLQLRLAPVLARRPDLAWPFEYYLYTSDEYNDLLYNNMIPELKAWQREQGSIAGTDPLEIGRVWRKLAMGPVMHRPGVYMKHVLANVVGSTWWFGRGTGLLPALAHTAPGGMECLSRLPASHRAYFEKWIDPPRISDSTKQWLPWERLREPIDTRPSIYATLAVASTLLGVVFLPWTGRRLLPASQGWVRLCASPSARFLGALAMMAWGSIVLISLSATVIFRYVDAIDPLLTAAIVIAIVTMGRAMRDRVRAARIRRDQLVRTEAAT